MTASAGLQEADHEAYWAAVRAADEPAAQLAVTEVLDRGVPAESALALVTGAQRRVGRLWADGAWTVAREHAATAIGEAVVRRLASEIATPEEAPLVLVACVEREWHALPAHVVTQVLRARGLRVDYVGANASRDLLVARIVDGGPRAVLLSASLSSSLTRVRHQVETVRGTGTPVIVGGSAFDADGVRARRLGATAYLADPGQVPALLADLPRHVPAAPPLTGPAAAEARALHADAEEIGHDVDTAVRAALGAPADEVDDPDDWRTVLTTFVPHVVDCLAGALLTEDAGVLVEARAWLTDVLERRAAAPEAVPTLWQALRVRLYDFPEALRLLAA